MGSDSIILKEVRVRMSGTSSNRNYGNLAPDVQLTFLTEGVENWDEALQQMINTTHDAFVHAAHALVGNFDGYRDADSMLAELGVKPITSISVMVPSEGDEDEEQFARRLLEPDDEPDGDQPFDPDRDEDGFGDDDEDLEDTKEVDTSHLSKIGADF